jgi:heat shock protein 5
MAYGLYKEKEQDILVFDLGGGTFDVSILSVENGTFQVLSTSGDTHLGGEDFDLRVVEFYSKFVKEKHQKDIKSDPKAFQKLKMAVEKAKRTLSSETEATIEIESLIDGIDFKQKLTRAKFEDLNKDLFLNTLKPVQQALTDAKLQKDDIDVLVLVGGSTRIPFIRNQLQKFFNGKKLHLDVSKIYVKYFHNLV